MSEISRLVQTAIKHFQTGDKLRAESLCREALAQEPREINALHIIGLIALQTGKPDQAIEMISRAISYNAVVPALHISLGNALQARRLPDRAIKSYRTALRLDARNPVAHNNLANVYTQQGRMEQARRHFQHALELQPDYAPAQLGLGNILIAVGQQDEAARCYQRALDLQPAYPEAHCYLGIILKNKGRAAEAIKHFEEALALRPEYTDAQINLGNALQDQRRFDAAIECFNRYLNLKPDDAGCHYNLGNALYQKGEMGEAIKQFEQAVALKPDFYQAHSNLGNTLYTLGQHEKAMGHLELALKLEPGYAEGHNNLGCLLKDKGYLQQAISHFEQALAARPDFTEVYSNTGVALQALGRLDEAIACYKQALEQRPDKADTFSNLLLTLNYSTDYDAATIFAEHQRYAGQFEAPLAHLVQPHRNDAAPGRRLKVGYVSADFRDHAVAYFIEPVFAHHAHEKFEIYCYYNHVRTDPVTQRLQGYADHWRSIAGLSDDETIRQIREDRIDILVDLAGHTALNRLTVFARKPAPVQVTWLGYLNTTGLVSMDYRITDAWASPPGEADRYHTETLLRLPDSQWCYCPPRNAPQVNALPALERGQITFSSFHTLAKITPQVARLWSDVLNAIPAARLLMVARGLEQQETREAIQSGFANYGVDSKRIDFLGSQSFEGYLRLHQQVDINLDTSPYTGGTTTCHSLWMGVPVITLAGAAATSRGGASLLNALGLTDLVAHTTEEYIDIARQLANDRNRLQSMRLGLRTLMARSPLTNGEQFTHNLERKYREIWTRWCRTHST